MNVNGQEVPDDVALVMSVNPVRRDREVWRVVAYRPDGSWFYVQNNSGPDYKLERNARLAAERHNASYSAPSSWSGGASFAVVKRIRVSESEV